MMDALMGAGFKIKQNKKIAKAAAVTSLALIVGGALGAWRCSSQWGRGLSCTAIGLGGLGMDFTVAARRAKFDPAKLERQQPEADETATLAEILARPQEVQNWAQIPNSKHRVCPFESGSLYQGKDLGAGWELRYHHDTYLIGRFSLLCLRKDQAIRAAHICPDGSVSVWIRPDTRKNGKALFGAELAAKMTEDKQVKPSESQCADRIVKLEGTNLYRQLYPLVS